MQKICTKCGKSKSLTDFHNKLDTKDGHRLECKECVNLYMVEYRKTHKKEKSEYDKKRYSNKKNQ